MDAADAGPEAVATTPMRETDLPNILSFDLEDWSYLVMRRFGQTPVPHVDEVTRQTDHVLELLSAHGVRATFFVLGSTAAAATGLVRRIADEGHEIATHGCDHRPIGEGPLARFAEDLRRAKAELAEMSGQKVMGYRAPAFSVPAERTGEFFDVLAEAGIEYDSSVVPMRLPRYGIADFGLAPRAVSTSGGGTVVEFPLSLVRWAGRMWMVAGGGYWRLFPGALIRRAIRRVRSAGRPLVTYFHNYEFDDRPLKAAAITRRSAGLRKWEARSNLFRRSIPGKLAAALREFEFVPFRDVLGRVRSTGGDGTAGGSEDDCQ
jgi:polysaccharide deacetylase family protein (PEP-CTERM system associated)